MLLVPCTYHAYYVYYDSSYQLLCSYIISIPLRIFSAAKDEWDFMFLGMSNHPFIKANYPHHEGVWGWGTVADQVVMMVRNIRRSMVEYHDILWDIGYAKTWDEGTFVVSSAFNRM